MDGKAPISRAACWGCGEQIPLKHGGDVCPLCGARLRLMDYDRAALDIVSTRIEKEKRLNALVQDRSEAEVLNARWGFLRKLPFLPSRRRINAIERERAVVLAEIKALARRSCELASARYYMGSWYRATGSYLRDDAPGADDLGCSPLESAYYDSKGMFHVKTRLKNKTQRGVFGEYLVFEQLATALERDGCLSGRLLRSLYIPDFSSCKRDPYGAHFTEEVDLLLATARALYVIEVKNLRGSITVRQQRFLDRYEVEVVSPGGPSVASGSNVHIDRAPSQNHRHACALRHALEGRVPHEAIVNLSVYVDNCGGFAMEVPQGLGGAYIATTGEGEHNVLEVIRYVEDSVPVRWNEDELAELVAFLDFEYSDVDGSKAEAHRRSREMRARAPRPSGSRGKSHRSHGGHGKERSSGAPTGRYVRDAELERMLRRLR